MGIAAIETSKANKIVPDNTHARVSSVVREGDATYGAFANDHHDVYTYGDRNERTKSKRYNNTSPGTTTNEDSGYHRQFVFDTAGSWDWFQLGSDPNTPYVPNALNLYASINDPNDPNTATESFTYDKDRNLTEDGSFEYAYDAENRMIEVVPAEDDPNNLTADDKKLVFTYDYINRRVRKVVYAWDPNEGDSGDWSATAELDLRFIYHERLLLLELDGLDSNAKVRKYVWGPGSDGRLGGLNSLLGVRDVDSDTNYVCFNNGTGSVAQLLDRSDGSVDAKYVYDTRGDTVRNTGPFADDNPLRYNGWYFDAELDYAGTDCDGLYCAADGNNYLPRLGRHFGTLDPANYIDESSRYEHLTSGDSVCTPGDTKTETWTEGCWCLFCVPRYPGQGVRCSLRYNGTETCTATYVCEEYTVRIFIPPAGPWYTITNTRWVETSKTCTCVCPPGGVPRVPGVPPPPPPPPATQPASPQIVLMR